MIKTLCALAVAATVAGLWFATSAAADDKTPSATAAPAAAPLSFKMKNIDGKDVDLSQYSGKVILMVNVASKCGNTPQYEGLEKTYANLKDKGFIILGFPANNFGGQEPGTNAEIKEFCEKTYQVAFPMFGKISVKGADQDPLYKYLTSIETKPQPKGDITWNFEKFLIAKDGKVAARFAPKTKIEDPSVMAAIDAELAK